MFAIQSDYNTSQMAEIKDRKIYDTAFLNGLRILLATWVAVGHFYQYLGGRHLFRVPLLSDIILGNGPAVDGFMIITGFLMAFHYDLKEKKMPAHSRKTIMNFWKKRFMRLAPLYYVCMVIALALLPFNKIIAPLNYQYFTGVSVHLKNTLDPGYILTFKDYIMHFFFLHGLFPHINTSILGPAWSLSTEMQFYFFFPFIYLFFFRNPAKKGIAILSIILSAAVIQLLTIKLLGAWDSPGKFYSFGAPSFIGHKIYFFFSGIIMAKVLIHKISHFYLAALLVCGFIFKTNIYALMILMFIILFLFFDQYGPLIPAFFRQILMKIKSSLSGSTASFLGEISYAIYLSHFMIMPLVMHISISCLSPFSSRYMVAFASFLLFVAITFGCSALLYKFVETPFIKIGKRKFG